MISNATLRMTAIGFYQEFGADKSIAVHKKMTAPQAKVRRDGNVMAISAASVIAGDILTANVLDP